MASLNPLQGVLGRRRAAHLLRRLSFRYTRDRVDELAAMTVVQALDSLLQYHPLLHEQPLYGGVATWINPPQPPDTPKPVDDEDLLRDYVRAWWAHEALHDPGAAHRITFFLHQFLAVSAKSGSSMAFFDYLSLMRWGALRNYKTLARKIVLDNCMLRYIDNYKNFASNPNLNFAREFFELHTIGKGQPAGPGDYTNYTEEDIAEAARVFTGFNLAFRHLNIDPDTNIPAGKGYAQSHDFGPKQFSARFNNAVISPLTQDEAGMMAELDALTDMIFAQEETARNFCRRLYRVFVHRNITDEIENEVIAPLAQTFRANNFEMTPVFRQLFESQHFFDEDDSDNADEIVGGIIKSPLELALQTYAFFQIPIPDPITQTADYLRFYLHGLFGRVLGFGGMDLFYPPDVAGYPGYFQQPGFQRQFFNSATIVARYKLPQMLLSGTLAWGPNSDASIGTKFDMAAWVRDSGIFSDPEDGYVLVQELLDYAFPEHPDGDRFNYFLVQIFLDGLPPADWSYEWVNYLATGDDSEVRIPLSRLLNAVMYSPEYQLA